jgi:hypothetical protein
MKYRLDERSLSGAFTDRLNPEIANRGLNVKLSPPNWPRPLVHDTDNRGCIAEPNKAGRLGRIVMPEKFK